MVKLLKIRDVKDPQRELGNAGIDTFVPNFSEQFMADLKAKNPTIDIKDSGINIGPQESVNIPLGIKVSIPTNIALEAANKSGVATKKKLFVGATVVDSSYQGEIHCHLVNVGLDVQHIDYGEKIIQWLPRYIDDGKIEIFDGVTTEEFYGGIKTLRGEGGFGSTGIN